jgi:predicted DNA-binding protein (UPF0251 family)
MPRRLQLEFELPDELLGQRRAEEIALKAQEALVMALLREHHLSQGKAAEILGISRYDVFELMTQYQVPVSALPAEELAGELRQPFPNSSRA